MKNILLISLLLFAFNQVKAQSLDLPSDITNGLAFPIGSKFTIKLVATDSINYDYSVIAFEPFEQIVDSWKNDDLFAKQGEDNTVMFYFCFGTHGQTDEEKEKNMKVLLLMKNYSKERLKYTSDIQREKDGEYESTSNIGMYPAVKGQEIWSYMIYSIGLREFQKNK